MGLDAVPEDVGSGTRQGCGSGAKISAPAAAHIPAGLAQISHGAVPNLFIPFLLPQVPKGIQKGISSLFLGCWDSSPVFLCELRLELQPLDMEHPQQMLGSDSEPQSSLTPVTSLTVPPKRGV